MAIPHVTQTASAVEAMRSAAAAPNHPADQSEVSFGQTINKMLEALNEPQLNADSELADLVQGKTDNVHNLVLSVVKADMSFRMALEIRNKLTEAYQEIMRMQI